MIVSILDGAINPALIEDATPLVQGLEFSTALPGLNDKASFRISSRDLDAFIRFQQYLSKRVIIYDPYVEAVWDGIIWSIEVEIGGHVVGPRDLGTVWNYVAVEYSDLLDSNRYALTSYVSDAQSQLQYGIKENLVSIGEATSSAANKVVQKYTNNHAQPFTGGDMSIPLSGESISLRINCVGWWATTHYRKFQSSITTTTTVQTRISEIVNRTVVPDAPASTYFLEFFDTNTGLIAGSDLVVARATLHVETVGSYFARMVSLGGDDNSIWYIGAEIGEISGSNLSAVGAPRIKVWQRPTVPDFYISAISGEVKQFSGIPVHPSHVRAGDMVQFLDVDPMMIVPQDQYDRIHTYVLASTTYNAESGILSGRPEGQDTDVDIILARMG